ncbi:C2H2 type zinc finger domain-containing protein [Magnaporthiopsis poae ATCC 64411]|uniref:C2H2 type zinc finger domain-containing protein n=1 Tax=Magnaporthiopsis poae (strain ATCC 64411 / 73-15) TaxID=644358 RepID=A0A0C4DRQ0_MAGP6|nr:C2H2 type zinc finger domain-containing protein [Magnaporthiopsis poae ATCC 64411]
MNSFPASTDEYYTDDDYLLKNSPLLKARTKVDTNPSPSSSLELNAHENSPPSDSRSRKPGRSSKSQPHPGDEVLITLLSDGRHPDIVASASQQALPSDTSETPDRSPSAEDDDSDSNNGDGGSRRRSSGAAARDRGCNMSVDDLPHADAPPPPAPINDLQSLAAGAMAAIALGGGVGDGAGRIAADLDMHLLNLGKAGRGGRPVPLLDLDTERERDEDRERDDRHSAFSGASPYSPQSTSAYSHSPLQQSLSPRHHQVGLRSPTNVPRNPSLPPIQGIMSPISDSSGSHNPLPSFRDTFSNLGISDSSQGDRRRSTSTSYQPHSPSGAMSRLASLLVTSPLVSLGEYRRGDLPSPATHLSGGPGPFYAHHAGPNGYPRHTDYSSSSATETPGSTGDYAHTPSATGSDGRMIHEAGLPPSGGNFVCKVPGCNSMPFHTQYLLNSHMNVHSSARPHYCPVKGCPRSEGGKGFKRKNEMIRHGLVHDSPGYICPFCPDREHKYPRPDNLQRHVRVHHVDKDKDDPMLRDVLAQRPDGPNRGRRRRLGPG